MTSLEEKTVKRETVYNGCVIDLHVDEVTLPNGKVTTREIVKHPGAVAIIALTDDDRIVFVRQFRKALEKTIVEIPAGKLEPGEVPHETALRELKEETGYTAKTLQKVTAFYTSPGFADEFVHVFVATDLERGEQQADDDEFVDCLTKTLDEAQALEQSGDICDAKTAYALLYLAARSSNS